MQYQHQGFNFTADGTSTTLKLEALVPLNLLPGQTGNNIFAGPVIDNLDLEISGGATQFPEPSSLSILTASGLLLVRRRRAG
jgi:hypothetical protein